MSPTCRWAHIIAACMSTSWTDHLGKLCSKSKFLLSGKRTLQNMSKVRRQLLDLHFSVWGLNGLCTKWKIIWFVWFLLLLLTLLPHYPAKQPLSEGQELKLKDATAVHRLIAVLLTSFSQGLSVQMYICECEQTEEKGKWWNQTIENLKFKAAMYIIIYMLKIKFGQQKFPTCNILIFWTCTCLYQKNLSNFVTLPLFSK